MKKQTLPRQSAHIVDFLTILWKNVSKGSERKRRKLARLVLHLTKIRIVQHGNALDADLKIILSQNVPSHLKKVRKDAILTNLSKVNSVKDNIDDDDDLKVYASMARISNDDVRKNIYYGDSSQLTNCILDSGATCHMTPEVTDFIAGSLEDTDKFIEVADGHHVTAKQKGSVRIKMFDKKGKTFVATLYIVLLAPDLCDRLFSIITLMNAGHTCLFHKGFCTV